MKEENLIKLSKKELIIKYRSLKGKLGLSRNMNITHAKFRRNIVIRLFRFRDEIDFILSHPFAVKSRNKRRIKSKYADIKKFVDMKDKKNGKEKNTL